MPLAPKTPIIPTEHEEQVCLFVWARLASKARPELWGLVAIPNGGKRPRRVAVQLQSEGVKKGSLDIQLLTPRGGYHGLLIELKRTQKSTTSPEQKEWVKWHLDQGYYAVVCKGWVVAKSVIEDYLDGKLNANTL
jgi:hypothetical protein